MTSTFQRILRAGLLLGATALSGANTTALAQGLADRWVYCPTNLQVDENVDKLEALFARAQAAGYNGVLLADSKMARLESVPDRYFANAERVKAAAAAHRLEIIPAVFSIGYSNDLLWHNPNLAEALPVRDALFVVRGDTAVLSPDPGAKLPGGQMDNLAAWTWHDETVTADEGAALVRDPAGRNARLCQRLTLKPHRQYHVSVRVRTQDFRGTPEIKALGARDGRDALSLIYSGLGVRPTQDWVVHHAVFNTLECTDISLYLGCWDGSTGSLWWDDARIEEVGLLNVVRRPGAPLTITLDARGGPRRALLEEMYFEPIADPDMGVHPWPGEYQVWHEPPVIHLKRPLEEGTRLRVSYSHAVTIYNGQVMICPSEPETVALLRDQARRVQDLWHAPAYFMSHDEIRCLNQDEACTSRGLSAGEILADNVRTCAQILREAAPGARIYVWSDMFDPNHNARDDYYLVRGDLAGSWEGLDRDVIVGCWYLEKRRESLAFFSGRGNPTLAAGFYDGPVGNIRQWLDAGAEAPGFRGVMYTTWKQDYSRLEAFAREAWGGVPQAD
ncbi:MAG: hypothetical protein IPJ41_04235 [Phycisphaerales bacterium]|nr:hypothetical protein [Phycisphaerales bacterium]